MVNSIMISRYLPQDVLKSIDRWIPQMINDRAQSKWLKARRARRALRLPYQVIGSGLTRIVYDLENGYVVKIAISKRGLMSNEREHDVYSHCSRRLRRYLCPIVEYGYGWVIMKKIMRCEIVTEQDDIQLQKLRRRLLKEKVIARSLRSKNLARLNERLIVIDYGSFRFKNI